MLDCKLKGRDRVGCLLTQAEAWQALSVRQVQAVTQLDLVTQLHLAASRHDRNSKSQVSMAGTDKHSLASVCEAAQAQAQYTTA